MSHAVPCNPNCYAVTASVTPAEAMELLHTVPIGLTRLEGGLNYGLYLITDMAIELGRLVSEGWMEVSVRSPDVHEITSFKERR